MKSKWAYVIVALLLLALAVGPGQAQGPEPPDQGTEPQGEVGIQAALGTAFTYQGQLKSSGSPVNGNCDLQFSLWDAASGGTQVGTTQTKTNVSVSNGLFTTSLDFGSAFTGDDRWLAIAVRCPAGSGSYTNLSPRQALTAAPYALSLRPGADIIGGVSGSALYAQNTSTSGTTYGVYGRSNSTAGRGVYGYAGATSGTNYGVYGRSNSTAGRGVYGYASAASGATYGVYGQSASPDGRGVYGYASAASGQAWGVWGQSASTSGRGVYGAADATSGTTYGVYGYSVSTTGRGVYGRADATSGPAYGVWGESKSTNGHGVYGWAYATSGTTYGVYGRSDSPAGRGVYGLAPTYGVYGEATATSGTTYGVYGESDSPAGRGVYGLAPSYGVYGEATATSGTTYGVRGESDSTNGRGVYGYASATSGTTTGVYGGSSSPDGYGVYGYNYYGGYAGYFSGKVHVNGTLSKSAGGFKIDHPLDPANKYLYHSFVESPDMMNVYNGNVVLDASGEAWVELPEWFEALNRDFRYQLTCVGGFAPVYIAEKIANNRFKIAGGTPGLEVSWQVTGIRQDPYANAHRIPVEVDKPAEEQGTYLYPEGYGQPKEMGLDYQRNADLLERMPESPSAGGGE